MPVGPYRVHANNALGRDRTKALRRYRRPHLGPRAWLNNAHFSYSSGGVPCRSE